MLFKRICAPVWSPVGDCGELGVSGSVVAPVRPALVPLAMAAALPLALLKVSLLAVPLSVPVSALLVGLAFVVGAERRRNAELTGAWWAQVPVPPAAESEVAS